MATLYPFDVELKRVAIEAWNVLSEMNLLGKIIWEMRGKSSLGVIGLDPLTFSRGPRHATNIAKNVAAQGF